MPTPTPRLIALAVLAVLAAGPAAGAGFGRSTNATVLGQPLNFTAVIELAPDESLTRDCVAAEVRSGENLLAAGQVRIALESPTGSTQRRLRVTTRVPIDEPVVTVTLALGCDARIERRFVAFVDPPVLPVVRAAADEAPPQAPAAAAPPVVDAAAARAEAPPADAVAPPAPRRPAAVPADAGGRDAATAGARSAARPAAASASSASAVPPARAAERRVASVVRPPPATGSASTPTAAPPSVSRTRPRPPELAAPSSGSRLQLETGPPPVVANAASAAAAPPSGGAARPEAAAGSSAVPAARPPAEMPSPVIARAETPPGAASAPSTTSAAGDAATREPSRVQALEEGIAALRADALANREALARLQARLQRAEAERYGSPLVYGLSLVSALLAIALAVVWRRQARTLRGGPQWWAGREPGPVPSMYRDRDAAPSRTPGPPSAPAALADTAGRSGRGGAEAVDDDGPSTLPPPLPPSRPRGAAVDSTLEATRPAPFVASDSLPPGGRYSAVPEPATSRESTVEELIDLEQQVDFFLVLGQDEDAVELLTTHVRGEGGISPLPWLKLLDLHRRRHDAEAYGEIRERFNRRFNAYAPASTDDATEGRSLVDYPETLMRLQALWPTPVRAMETLDASLFRRDASEDTFDLAAYRELLMLYAIARDLAEQDAAASSGAVDLLLPLDDPRDRPIEHLSATPTGFDDLRTTNDPVTLPLDFEVSIAPAPPAPATPTDAETVPSALRRTDDRPFSTASNFPGLGDDPSPRREPG